MYAFEPSPKTLETLRLNTEQRHNVSILDKAVSNASGEIRFFHADDYLNSGSVANPPFKEANEVAEISVQAISFDEYFPNDFEINFLKIDIQGDDLKALEGARQIIQRSPSIKILFEWAPTWMKNASIQAEELPNLLKRLGFDKLTVLGDFLGETYSVGKFLEISRQDISGKRFCNLLAEK